MPRRDGRSVFAGRTRKFRRNRGQHRQSRKDLRSREKQLGSG